MKLVFDNGEELPVAWAMSNDNCEGSPHYNGIVDVWEVYVPTLIDQYDNYRELTMEEWKTYVDSRNR